MKTVALGDDRYILRFGGGTEDFFYDGLSGAVAVDALCGAERSSPTLMVIVGPTGCGKTHLLGGFTLDYGLEHPGSSVRMLPARELLSELAAADGAGKKGGSAGRRGTLELLVLDDVDELAGKPAAQKSVGEAAKIILSAGGHVVMLLEETSPGYSPLLRWLRRDFKRVLLAVMRYPGEECRRSYALARRDSLYVDMPDCVPVRFAQALPTIGSIRGALTVFAASEGEKTAEDILRLYRRRERF